MAAFSGRQNRRLLFRTYAVIVGGLVLVAAALDFSFSRLQEAQPPAALAWIDSSLALIESRLAATPASEWSARAVELEAQLGYPVRILPLDHFVQLGQSVPGTQEVFDSQGRAAYFRRSNTLDAGIQIGPLRDDSADSRYLTALAPTFFYVAIVAVVSLWIWPLLRDVNLLTAAARDFAADYRRPMTTRDKTTTLKDLASSFDEMSERIHDLIQSQKDLSSALSHEVRTPLARIKFAMAVMADRANIAGELESIDQDVQEIDRLIGTMLDYARLDHPDATVNWQLTPVDAWLEHAVKKNRGGHGAVSVETVSCDELVRMDPYLMELALSNLLVNACRYAARKVVVHFRHEGDNYALSIADDGPGIPELDRLTVFKPFTRLDNSRNRKTGGYGLGLAIVARIATRHGGTVRAEPSELGGAAIVLSWPAEA